MSQPPETCQACRFDGAAYDLHDSLGTLLALCLWSAKVIDALRE